MRLLYVCSDFGIAPRGTKGASVHLRAITRALAELGHEVLLLSPKEGPGDGHPAQCVLPHPRRNGRKSDESVRQLKRWLMDRGLNEAVARELRSLLFNAWVAQEAQQYLTDQPPDAVVERLSLFGHTGVDLAQAFDRPLILEVNAPLTKEASMFRSLQLRALAGEIERRAFQRADRIIVVSAPLARRLIAQGIEAEKIHVIPNGADPRRFDNLPSREECRAALGLTDEFVIGFAGSLKAWHGVDVLLRAFGHVASRNPKARLLIVGTGTREAHLRELATQMGLGRSVLFTGAVEHDEVGKLLGAMDVATAPFRNVDDFYFSPIKLFEYMAVGLCIVASKLGQIAEVLEHGVDGLLSEPDDARDLADRLEEAGASAALRARLAAHAKRKFRQRYTWSHTGRATQEVIRAAIESRRHDRCQGDNLTVKVSNSNQSSAATVPS